jgi:formate-dependent nitrite reductase membrane component NrfD
MTSRFSLALILIGVIVMMVFLITTSNQQGDLTTLLVGAALCLIGMLVRRRAARAERLEAGRFQLLRRVWSRGEDPEDN